MGTVVRTLVRDIMKGLWTGLDLVLIVMLGWWGVCANAHTDLEDCFEGVTWCVKDVDEDLLEDQL